MKTNPIQIGFLDHVARPFTLPFASDPDPICAFRLFLTTRPQATLRRHIRLGYRGNDVVVMPRRR